MSILSKRLSKIESELLVAVQPNRFIHIQRCGYNKDSDIIGYNSWLDRVRSKTQMPIIQITLRH